MQGTPVGREGPLGQEAVDVRVAVQELAQGLDGQNATGCGVVTQQGAVSVHTNRWLLHPGGRVNASKAPGQARGKSH